MIFSINIKGKTPHIDPKGKTQTEFGYNAGAGLAYNLNEYVTIDLINYKYYDLGQVSTQKDAAGEHFSWEIKNTQF